MKNGIKLRANAKINLSLYISGKRDDGYHEIDTVMQSVSLFDRITIKKSDDISLTCSKPYLSGGENLGYKSAELFFREMGIKGGAQIYIEKNIPEAGGLGGGSADGAAVLLGLNRLYKTRLSTEKLEKMAVSLGADVPFFIRGGTVRARGIGEKLSSLKPFKKGYFVLAKGGEKPSTGEMYRRLDSKEQPFIDVSEFIASMEKGRVKEICESLENSFAEVWEDKSFENRLRELGPLGVGLSGSGPTYFAVFASRKKAKQALLSLKKEGITAFLVRPVKKSIIFE